MDWYRLIIPTHYNTTGGIEAFLEAMRDALARASHVDKGEIVVITHASDFGGHEVVLSEAAVPLAREVAPNQYAVAIEHVPNVSPWTLQLGSEEWLSRLGLEAAGDPGLGMGGAGGDASPRDEAPAPESPSQADSRHQGAG